MDGADLVDPVGEAMRAVAAEVILPRFRVLVDGDVSEKEPGELVTVADTAAERELTGILSTLLPGSLVVGEEAVAADPDVLRDAARRPAPGCRSVLFTSCPGTDAPWRGR